MQKAENVIIHCSDSEWGCAREIRDWHLQRGWRDIGYHFVILNGFVTHDDFKNDRQWQMLDGSIECGRYLTKDGFISAQEIGAHALGHNRNSIGICLIGKKDFTAKQMCSLLKICLEMKGKFDLQADNFIGHREVDNAKTCPNFDIGSIRSLL